MVRKKRIVRNKRKKGALALSVSTIVVIVIGVTLLSLGLLFVRNMFIDIGDLSDIIIGDAKAQLDQMLPGEDIIKIPPLTSVAIGKSKTFNIQIANDGSAQSSEEKFKIIITPNPKIKNPKINIYQITEDEFSISEGQKAKILLLATVDKRSKIDNAGFSVTVMNGDEVYAQSGFVISPEMS